jgi:hypothetical protein
MNNFLSRYAVWVVALICVAAFLLLSWGAVRDGITFDEKAHIPSGYADVHQLDYRLNPEHPPLLKVLAGIPLLFFQPKFDTTNPAWTDEVNGQWHMGDSFLFQSGNDADQIVRWSRFGPILMTLLAIILVYIVSLSILGPAWALLPTALFGLSPTILGNGHFVTTDIAGTFGILLAIYYFAKLLQEPSETNLWKAGLAFGVAQLAKFSAFLLFPIFVLLGILKIAAHFLNNPALERTQRIAELKTNSRNTLLRVVGVFAIGILLVVNLVYTSLSFGLSSDKQASQMETMLTGFAGGSTAVGATCKPMRCPADLGIWMAKNPVTKPLAWWYGGILMATQRGAGGNTNYFMGSVSAKGVPYYFPLVYLMKETIPGLLVVFFGFLLGLTTFFKNSNKRSYKERFGEFFDARFLQASMLVFISLYWLSSVISPLNIGVRHIIPTLPFIYILATLALKNLVKKRDQEHPELIPLWQRRFPLYIGIILAVGIVTETALAAPYYLAYYNALSGGTSQGYRYATDSNYDWGQDFLRFTEWMQQHPEVDKIAMQYFGGADIKYYLGDRIETWWSSRGNPTDSGIKWFAISVNELQGRIQPTKPGYVRDANDDYKWLTDFRPKEGGIGGVPKPDYRVGTSIFIYKLQ